MLAGPLCLLAPLLRCGVMRTERGKSAAVRLHSNACSSTTYGCRLVAAAKLQRPTASTNVADTRVSMRCASCSSPLRSALAGSAVRCAACTIDRRCGGACAAAIPSSSTKYELRKCTVTSCTCARLSKSTTCWYSLATFLHARLVTRWAASDLAPRPCNAVKLCEATCAPAAATREMRLATRRALRAKRVCPTAALSTCRMRALVPAANASMRHCCTFARASLPARSASAAAAASRKSSWGRSCCTSLRDHTRGSGTVPVA
jgi:hypothetical protein